MSFTGETKGFDMSAKVIKNIYIPLLILCLIASCFSMQTLAEGYELVYEDPEGDVEDFEGTTYQYGYEHIDILEISSSENLLGTQVILEMTVKGVITDSEYITYSFVLFDGESMVYMVSYTNGVASGMDSGDENPVILQSSGSGTSTLEVRVQESDLGEISEFDFFGDTSENDDVNKEFFMDMVPDLDFPEPEHEAYEMAVTITEPRPGATASGTKIIEGVTDSSYEMESVEIQFDSESESGWIITTTTDNWDSWSYQWDTSDLPDGKHTLNARAYNGTEYFFDSVTVYVDQTNPISPDTTEVPTLKIGGELTYSIDLMILEDDLMFEGMEVEVESEVTMRIMKKESIEVDSDTFETYAIDLLMTMDMTMTMEGETISSSATGEGTQWLRISDLATIKAFTKTSYTTFGISSFSESTITYDPPVDSYNFPMSIAETWISQSTVTTEDNFEEDGESIKESYESEIEYEALHVEDVTVPAGTFETFVIWAAETSSDYSGGGGTPFFGTDIGYSINYYSPEIGFPVKTDNYHPNRELIQTMELISYRETQDDTGKGSGGFGWEIPVYFLLFPIFLAVLLGTVMGVRRRRRRADMDSWQQSPVYPETHLQPDPNLPIAPQSQVHASQPQPRTLPLQPPPPPKTVKTATLQSPPPPPHPPTVTNVQKTHLRQPDRGVIPSIQIKCPKCTSLFFVQRGSLRVQCPNCKTVGNLRL
jgi:hypothetical protein